MKGDARRAEEYYSRAMLADPSDGEIISQYAKLVWAVHRDHDRSLVYFQKSVQAAPRDRYAVYIYSRPLQINMNKHHKIQAILLHRS